MRGTYSVEPLSPHSLGLSIKPSNHVLRSFLDSEPTEGYIPPSVGISEYARYQELGKCAKLGSTFRRRISEWDEAMTMHNLFEPRGCFQFYTHLLNYMLCYTLVPHLGVWSDIYKTSTCRPTHAVA